MLSIVVPVYNAAAHLRECVDSVISQTSPDWELILVDDGSTDDSPAICDSYAASDPRIHVIHQPNSGVSAARNAGIDTATGEYVSFIDSDDYVLPNYCEVVLHSMLPDFDLLYFGNYVLRDSTKLAYSPPSAQARGAQQVFQSVLSLKSIPSYEFFGFTWNKCFRRSLIIDNHIAFQVGLAFREDDLFTSSFIHYVESVCFIEDNLYVYRESSLGLTHTGIKPQAVFSFIRSLTPLADKIPLQALRDFEASRMADMILMLAKCHRSCATDAFSLLNEIVSAHPQCHFSRQVSITFAGFMPHRFMFHMLLFLWDVKQSLLQVRL